jgi:GNAT superfamily N-acetyltransferase
LAGVASGRLVEGARPAEAGDLERCRELLNEASAAIAGQRGADLLLAGEQVTPGEPASDVLERWQAEPLSEVFVGTFSQAVVGIAVGTLTQLGRRRVGRIDCFYVEPDARKVGVGQALVGLLVEWFTERGCSDVDAIALPGDRSSKQLLEASGFKARLLILHRSLG